MKKISYFEVNFQLVKLSYGKIIGTTSCQTNNFSNSMKH